MILYLLAFKNEPLVKIGISAEPPSRWDQLGARRFDLARSYMAECPANPSLVRALEQSLKAAFSARRGHLERLLPSGNTEVFDASILPNALRLIEAFASALPESGLSVRRDLAGMVRKSSDRSPLVGLERLRRGKRKQIEENRQKLSQLKGLAQAIDFRSVEVLEDSTGVYETLVRVKAPDPVCLDEFIRSSVLLVSDRPFTTRCGYEDGTHDREGAGTLRIRFDLAGVRHCEANPEIERDPTPWEALDFWRGLVQDPERKVA